MRAYDPRTGRVAWQVDLAGSYGTLGKLAVDPSGGASWVLGGTARGFLVLWDIRF